ncbi:hypothetical protein GCM10020367_20260 [Streptomyces sannanensis]|uniref:Pyrrolo-quinoline quinone repeat domain-containing protein n=1 Tax=Streptomyces sannanensis TaxID=285536 RepID=A0ABP6S903_9ACTN
MSKAAAVIVAGGLLGAAVIFIVGGFRMAAKGGDCTDSCLPGHNAVNTWALCLTVAGIAAAAAAITWAVRGGTFRARWLPLLLAAGALAALWPAGAWQRSIPSPTYAVGWRATEDRPDTTRGLGNWAADDTVVRARVDGLSGFAVRDGKERWVYQAPARQSVCAMSTRTAMGLGVIGLGRHGKPCATVAAVRLGTGKVLWTQRLATDIWSSDSVGRIALADTTAVAVEAGAVRGFSAESGKQRWKRTVGEDCGVLDVDASARRAVFVEECDTPKDEVRHRIVAVDAATGKELWNTRLPTETRLADLRMISAEPAVIRLKESDERGVNAVLAFDDRGRPGMNLPLSGRAGNLAFTEGTSLLVKAAPDVFVAHGTLVTGVRMPEESDTRWIAGFRLTDGRRVWLRRLSLPVSSLARRGAGQVAAIGQDYEGSRIWVLDTRTGADAVKPLPVIGKKIPTSYERELLPVDDGYVVANTEASYGSPPFFRVR